MVHSNPAGTVPLQLCTMIMTNPQKGSQLPGILLQKERLCQRCSCSAVDDEAHMIWGCPALIDQRVQHSELFEDSTITSVSDFLQQDAGQLAPFLRVYHDLC